MRPIASSGTPSSPADVGECDVRRHQTFGGVDHERRHEAIVARVVALVVVAAFAASTTYVAFGRSFVTAFWMNALTA